MTRKIKHINLVLLFYGYESWILDKKDRNHLETIEIWEIGNKEQLYLIQVKFEYKIRYIRKYNRNIIKILQTKHVNFIGHLIRHSKFMTVITEGKVLAGKSE